jgi:hypothetical protein
MATSYKGQATRIHIPSAGAARTTGVPVVESGWVGIPLTSAASGASYTLAVEGEFEIDFITSCVVGDFVTIDASSNALARSTSIPDTSDDKRILGKVTAVPGASGTGTFGNSPVSGKMWIKLMETAQYGPVKAPAA